jgi:prepilin-type processing-associated H-X9-DG protein
MPLGRAELWHEPLMVATPNHPYGGVDNFNAFHPGIVNFLFADGSVKSIKDAINPTSFMSVMSRRGRDDVISSDQY